MLKGGATVTCETTWSYKNGEEISIRCLRVRSKAPYRSDLDFDVMDGSIVDIRLAMGVRVLHNSVTEDDAFCR
jgi:hypothetical protein